MTAGVAEATLHPARPYSLALSASGPRAASRRFAGGRLEAVFDTAGGPARALARQLPGGSLEVRLEGGDPVDGMARLRALLAVDLDLGPFLARVAGDPLLAGPVRRYRGMRPLPVGSVAQALLRGITGQLVRSSDARRMEMAVTRRAGRRHGDLLLPLTTAELRRLTPAELRAAGIAGARARALARAAREVDLDALPSLETAEVARRLSAVPGIGPWTVGVVCLSGLGRVDHGLVGDLGLMKLLAARTGAVPDEADTAALLAAYGEYAGLASLYLLRGHPATGLPATVAEIARATAAARRGGGAAAT